MNLVRNNIDRGKVISGKPLLFYSPIASWCCHIFLVSITLCPLCLSAILWVLVLPCLTAAYGWCTCQLALQPWWILLVIVLLPECCQVDGACRLSFSLWVGVSLSLLSCCHCWCALLVLQQFGQLGLVRWCIYSRSAYLVNTTSTAPPWPHDVAMSFHCQYTCLML